MSAAEAVQVATVAGAHVFADRAIDRHAAATAAVITCERRGDAFKHEREQQNSPASSGDLSHEDDLPAPICRFGQSVDLSFEVDYLVRQIRHFSRSLVEFVPTDPEALPVASRELRCAGQGRHSHARQRAVSSLLLSADE